MGAGAAVEPCVAGQLILLQTRSVPMWPPSATTVARDPPVQRQNFGGTGCIRRTPHDPYGVGIVPEIGHELLAWTCPQPVVDGA